MIGYIYKVTNKINVKFYIGQTIQSVKDRWYRHCGKSGISKAELNTHFKRAILKYGKENFTIETIEVCDSTKLNDREKFYISYYNSYINGYNSTIGGQGGTKPFKTSEESETQIISLYNYGFSLREIGREFNLDKTTVKGILVRHNISIRTTRTYKLSSTDRTNIMNDLDLGLSRKEIINKYNISESYLSQLITGNRRI